MKYNKKALYEKCLKHNIEPLEISVDNNKKIIFMCPKIPDKKIKSELLKDIPTIQYQFIESPKTSTRDGLHVLLKSINFYGILQPEGRKLTISSTIKIEDDHPFWNAIQELLYQDGYFTDWKVTIGEKSIIYNEKIAKEIQSHVLREHTITEDDQRNLTITLFETKNGKEKDVLDIIKEL